MSGVRVAACMAALAAACAPAAEARSAIHPQPDAPAATQDVHPAMTPVGQEANTVALVAHRASYDLALSSVSGNNIVSASGGMSYDVRDECNSWSTQQEIRIQTVSRSGAVTNMVSDYTTLESKDGRHLDFRTTQTTNGNTVEQLSGEAIMAADGSGVVHYAMPAGRVEKLPVGTMLPMAHTRAIILAGEHGAASLDPMLFDGTEAGGAEYSYVTIFGHQPRAADLPFPVLNSVPSMRVHVAFFGQKSTDMLPDYEMGMRYFVNGVSDQLDMDFGDFRMKGTLHGFELRPAAKKCG